MGCLVSTPLQKTSISGGNNPNTNFGSFSIEQKVNPDTLKAEDHDMFNFGLQYEQQAESFRIEAAKSVQVFEWEFISEIGKGSRSKVFLVKNTETGQICAAKVYDKGLLSRRTLESLDPPYIAVQREVEIMAAASHRYVLSVTEIIEDECSNSFIILMPYAERGTLQDYIDKHEMTEDVLKIAYYEIAEGLKYIHSLNIVHRDIKPENVLVFSDIEYVVSDFSVSTPLANADELLVDTYGSPAFLSPEECGQEPFAPKPADVWSYGVSLYYSVYKKFPFNLDSCHGQSAANIAISVTNLLNSESLEFPEKEGVPPPVIDLIKRILNKDPTKRPTFEEIVQDPWFESAKEIDAQNFAKWEILQKEEEEKRKSMHVENTNVEEECRDAAPLEFEEDFGGEVSQDFVFEEEDGSN